MSAFDIDSDIGLNKSASGATAPKPILPFISVGTALTANEKGFLSRDNITTVFDVCPSDEATKFKHEKDFEYIGMRRKGGDDESEDSLDASDDDNEGDVEDVQKVLKDSYSKLKDLKAGSKKVLVYSSDMSWVATIVASYMLQSSKALDKYLPLSKALEFLKAKDIMLDPAEYLLDLVVLEEELFEEVSVKLPSNSRGKKGTIRKGGPKKGGRR